MRTPNFKNPLVAQAFGQHLRQLRQVRGWSRQALADNANVAQSTIKRIELGQLSPTLDLLASLAHGLELPLHTLLPAMEAQQPAQFVT